MNRYIPYTSFTNDYILNFEAFYKYIIIGVEGIAINENDVQKFIENARSINHSFLYKFNISEFSEEDKKLLYKDCKSETITIKEYLKKQSYTFNELKFYSIKRKYKEILKLIQVLEPFVLEDDILEYMELQSDFEEMFNEIDRHQEYILKNSTAKKYVEELDELEKLLNIGTNFKTTTPTAPNKKDYTKETWFIVSLKFVDGTVYDLKQKYPNLGLPLTREVFKDLYNENSSEGGLSKEDFKRLIENYRHFINDTLRSSKRNLFKGDEESKKRWLKVIKHCKTKPSQSFIDNFIEVYGYDPTKQSSF